MLVPIWSPALAVEEEGEGEEVLGGFEELDFDILEDVCSSLEVDCSVVDDGCSALVEDDCSALVLELDSFLELVESAFEDLVFDVLACLLELSLFCAENAD